MTTRLDVSIGPVQGIRLSVAPYARSVGQFVSTGLSHGPRDARRAVQAGGRITQPVVDGDALYAWVCGDRRGRPPRIGTVPNHFVVEVSGAAGPIAKAAEQALGEAWMTVCRSVWERFVAHACPTGRGTDAIWKRQIESFWDVTWTAGPGNDGARLMARRKQWRTHRPPDEPGDKCTVMHDLQEISGHVGVAHRARQKEFWMQVGSRLGSLDLQAGERLCAIALVKRLFPKQEVCGAALGWPVDASHWRSTVSIGALPWIREVMEAVPQQAREYAQVVSRHVQDVFMERPPSTGRNVETAGAFARLDANYLHCDFVASERRCPLSADATQADRDELGALLKKIYDAEAEDGRRLGPPPAFYALLLADGDRMGDLVGAIGRPVRKPCVGFVHRQGYRDRRGASRSDGIRRRRRRTMPCCRLPAPCSARMHSRSRFGPHSRRPAPRHQATLSAAVVFVHVRLPLRSVLHEAHHLLDDVAKDGNGRNSLAVGVLKHGGRHAQWVTTWTRAAANGARAVTLIEGLVRQLETDTATPGLSSALLYRVRKLLTTALWLGPLATGRVAQRSRRSRSPPVPPCRDRSQPRRADGVPDR